MNKDHPSRVHVGQTKVWKLGSGISIGGARIEFGRRFLLCALCGSALDAS